MNKNNKKYFIFYIASTVIAVAILAYLIFLPFFPALKYNAYQKEVAGLDLKNVEVVKDIVSKEAEKKALNKLPTTEDKFKDRIIIPKIGVNAPIIISNNSAYALNLGSWIMPDHGTPDKAGNTIITGHRFKYLPPNNLTFYSLDKLEAGDIISVFWKNKYYYYKAREKKVVPNNDFSILNNTDSPVLTLFTCDPIWSEENRLVIVSDLIK